MTVLLREAIGDVLRQTRVSQRRTLREVSDSAPISLGYLSEIERGRKEVSSELLSAICGALDTPMSAVLFAASRRMAGAERVNTRAAVAADIANIDAGTKVVIPPVTVAAGV